MDFFLKVKNGNILNNHEVIFTKAGAHEHIFLYKKLQFAVREKTTILQSFLGLKNYLVYNEENITRYVGCFKMKGLRKLEIDLTKGSRQLSAKISLMPIFFKIEREFKIESTSYYYQKKGLHLISDYEMDEFDVLIGCFMLYQLSQIGAADEPFDVDI